MERVFGTDGIRGRVNTYPMTAEMAVKIGQAVGLWIRNEIGRRRSRVVIGKDTRLSGYMLESALASGLISLGADVLFIGPMPTPGVAFLTRKIHADCGIVISASHNPYDDNGIKLFNKDGFKLSDIQEREIEKIIFQEDLSGVLARSDEIGRAFREEHAWVQYFDFLKKTFPSDMSLSGLKIVLDCANGAVYKIAPVLFKELGADVTALNIRPDGKNINKDCGSTHPEALAREVQRQGADAGLAFDGDGDRVIAVDEDGEIVDGDQILAVCARSLKNDSRLANDRVVHTVMSNFGLTLALNKMNIKPVVSSVGDRNVLMEMQKIGAVLGGENSGHLIFLEHQTTGDGLVSALQLLAVMKKENSSLSELAGIMDFFPQILVNVPVKNKPPLKEIKRISAAIADSEKVLDGKGRILVRYSGTQDLCRVMVEGPSQDLIERLARNICDVIKDTLNE